MNYIERMRKMLLQLIIFNLFLYKTEKYQKSFSLYVFSNVYAILMSLLLWENYEVTRFIPGTILYVKPGFIINGIFVLFSILLIKLILDIKYMLKKKEIILKNFQLKKKHKLLYIVFSIFTFIGILLFESSRWAIEYFDGLRIDQIIYTLSQPLSGSDPQQFINFATGPVFHAVIYTNIILVIFYHLSTYYINIGFMNRKIVVTQRMLFKLLPIVGIVIFFFSINKSIIVIGKEDVKTYFFETTSLYEDHYVEPNDVAIEFTERKNLIYIMLESMESSFTSEEFGGYGSENLIPKLTQLALEEGVHFSNSEKLGGAFQVPGTNQTVTGTVAQTAGTPVRIDLSADSNANYYGMNQTEGYLPGAYALGDVLDAEGYEQMYFIGSDASFAGRDNYFTNHGNFEIRDLFWAREQGLIPEDYYEWWGFEDEKLYQFAKDSLLELAKRGKPFNFTMLTTNTHFPHGYLSKETELVFDEQYSNVVLQADKLVFEFINWIKEQDFYENTVIVVVGDHLSMDKEYFSEWDDDYERTIFNLYLNTDKKPINNTNRQFTSLDLYATTLSAMTAEIEGNRLGLGVDLFSEEDTIVEKIGLENFSNELLKRSKYYQENILQGTDIISELKTD